MKNINVLSSWLRDDSPGLMRFPIVVTLLVYKGSALKRDGCTAKDCAHPLNNHPLLHLVAPTRSLVYQEKENSRHSSSPSISLRVHNASVTDCDRGFVLLKVLVRVVSESGLAPSTYGFLDTAAVSAMINPRIAAKWKLQGVPDRVSLNTVHYLYESRL